MESTKFHASQSGAQRSSPRAAGFHDHAAGEVESNSQNKRERTKSLPEPRVFSQRTSSRTSGFLKKNESIIGEAAVRKLQKGVAPSASEIRAAAIQSNLTHKGAGLHEIVVTSLGPDIAKLPNKGRYARQRPRPSLACGLPPRLRCCVRRKRQPALAATAALFFPPHLPAPVSSFLPDSRKHMMF